MTVKELIESKLIWRTDSGWGRLCPKCNSIIEHVGSNSKYHTSSSVNRSIPCKSCTATGQKRADEWKKNMSKRMTGKNHPLFGTHPSKETLKKLSNSHKGKVGYWKDKSLPQRVKEKISLTNTGRQLSEETKEKMRIARMVQIEKLGGGPTYNKNACDFINKLNQECGCNFQHALNGGEQMIAGYYVDGYDKEKNIVFEYDEPHHSWNYKKEKDVVRQQRIINKINPKMFIRYNEKNSRLYDALTNADVHF